jgi:hypothetical protein
MLIRDFKASIPYLIKAKVVALVHGAHGVGKSSIVKQVCDDNGWHFTDLRIGSMSDAGDLIGLPDFKTDNKGNKVSTSFFMPDWLKESIDFCKQNTDKYSVLFLDEINRARKDLQTPLFQMILDHRLHTHVFPENLFIISAANYNTDDYNVSDFSDKALVSRFAHIKLTPSVKEWVDFSESEKVDSTIIQFINEQKGMLEKKGEEFTLDFIEPSRRSWHMASRLIKSGMPQNLFQEWFYGIVGVTATAAYLESLKSMDKPLTGEEILKSYKKHKVTIKKWSEAKDGGRFDILKSSTDSLVKHIQDLQKAETKLKKAEGANMLEFLKDIPLDMSFAAVQDIYLEDNARDFFVETDELILKFAKTRGIE